MIATLILLGLIGVIVRGSRKARQEYVIEVASPERRETWRFDIREMRGELVRTASKIPLRSIELRRSDAGRWTFADDEALPEEAERRWSPCEADLERRLEAKYVRYNGG